MKVTDAYASSPGAVVLCDFSPPRSGDPAVLDDARLLDADFICVAYNPGKAVRPDSISLASQIKREAGKDVVFNFSPRDMNRLALQSHLLGAQIMGLENVLIVQGDPMSERESEYLTAVNAYTATGLIASIGELNQGLDYRGLKLRAPTDFCIGASMDLGRGLDGETRLLRRKVEAGAHFVVAQPIFDTALREELLARYRQEYGEDLTLPVFWGLQVLVADGLVFGNVPAHIKADLDKGRDGAEIALELYEDFAKAGIRGIYLVPPILRGGARDYQAAQRVLQGI